MIPDSMPASTPRGEVEVFNSIKNCPSEWRCFHSLDLAPYNKSRRTEIDFVVVIPDLGILCVEVKSHDHIALFQGRWEPEGFNKRNPFEQARSARYTLRDTLKKFVGDFSKVPIAHCCIFTHAMFELNNNVQFKRYELIDQRVFDANRSGAAFSEILRKVLQTSIKEDPQLVTLEEHINDQTIASMADRLRATSTYRPTARGSIERRKKELGELLVAQQRNILGLREDNHRMIVDGPAGTGKTLIAMELALRCAEEGKRTALLCFNNQVGKWLKKKTNNAEEGLPNLVVGSVLPTLLSLSRGDGECNKAEGMSFNDDVDLLAERLTDPHFMPEAIFDVLIVDEAQDVLARPEIWESLMQFLSGGERDGCYYLFGDFQYQVIADIEAMNRNLKRVKEIGAPVNIRLRENCRNFQSVGDMAVSLAGFNDSPYAGYLHPGGQLHNFEVCGYSDRLNQRALVKERIEHYLNLGYRRSEMVILNLSSNGGSCAESLEQYGGFSHIDEATDEDVGFTSAEDFKGLERPIVLITDVELENTPEERNLLYCALTRSTREVTLFFDKRYASTLVQWMERRL